MAYPVIEVPDDACETIEQLGSKPKFWFDQNRRLYKQGRPGTGENWAEKVACEICELLEIPHAHYEFGLWRDQPGVVSDSICPAGSRLVHGNELLSKIHLNQGAGQRYEPRQHTVSAFIGIGKSSRIEPPAGYDLLPPLSVAADLMVGYLMLDCLIGNQDRHDENWGLIVYPEKPQRITLAPTYDHASSLGRNETDERRRSRLVTRDRGASVDAYCARARSAFYDHADPRKPITTLDAFASAGRFCRAASGDWLDRLAGVGHAEFEAIFQAILPTLISEPAIDFALRMLMVNRARLLDIGLEKR